MRENRTPAAEIIERVTGRKFTPRPRYTGTRRRTN